GPAGAGLPAPDRPFKSFGGAIVDGAPTSVGAWYPTDITDTIMRNRTDVVGGTPVVRPLFSRVDPATPGLPPLHPYQTYEPLRKAMNSFTTVSDIFLVVMTVGFFEVRQGSGVDPNNAAILGKEVYDRVPGDMRSQHVAVIDRSRLVASYANNGTNNFA